MGATVENFASDSVLRANGRHLGRERSASVCMQWKWKLRKRTWPQQGGRPRSYRRSRTANVSDRLRPLARFAGRPRSSFHQSIIAAAVTQADADAFSSGPLLKRARSRSPPTLPVVTPRSGPPSFHPTRASPPAPAVRSASDVKKAAPGGHLGAALTASMAFVNRQIIACMVLRVNSSLDIHGAASNPLMLGAAGASEAQLPAASADRLDRRRHSSRGRCRGMNSVRP